MPKSRRILTILFLAAELFLYHFILTAVGAVQIWCSYSAIIICFLFAVSCVNKENGYIVTGLLFTVLADFFLVVCNPIQQLWGMVFFLPAQICYGIYLHRQALPRCLLPIRIALLVAAEIATALVLRGHTDLLAVISVAYYVNLILNLVCAFFRFKQNKLLAAGFLCFLLCDTVIGLQVAALGYLPITEGSVLHRIIFVDFNVSWFFYLPSQVLIALSSHRKAAV